MIRIIVGQIHDPAEKLAKVEEVGLASSVFDEVGVRFRLFKKRPLVVEVGVHVDRDPHPVLPQLFDCLV